MNSKPDLLKGSVTGSLIRFSAPLLLANLLQSLYSIVDMVVVGQKIGSTGVAAISNASTIVFIVNAICLGATLGSTVLVAHYKGANNVQLQRDTISATFLLTFGLGLLVTLIGLLSYVSLLELMKVPSESFNGARQYLSVIFSGTLLMFGYNAAHSILRGFGDSLHPFIFIAVATAINIILDVVFVVVLDKGTVGAAYATVMAQGVAFAVSFIYLVRHRFFCGLTIGTIRIKRDVILSLVKISLPTTIQMTVVNLSYAVIATLLNEYGVVVAAAAGIGLKINTLAGMSCWAIGSAITTMVAQNMGAGHIERTRTVLKKDLVLNLVTTMAFVVLIQTLAPLFISAFDNSSASVVEIGVEYLRICCFLNSLVYVAMYTFDSFAIGVGFPVLAMINALLDAAFIRLPLCLVLACVMDGYVGIFWAQALAPLIPAIIGWVYYLRGRWAERRLA